MRHTTQDGTTWVKIVYDGVPILVRTGFQPRSPWNAPKTLFVALMQVCVLRPPFFSADIDGHTQTKLVGPRSLRKPRFSADEG